MMYSVKAFYTGDYLPLPLYGVQIGKGLNAFCITTDKEVVDIVAELEGLGLKIIDIEPITMEISYMSDILLGPSQDCLALGEDTGNTVDNGEKTVVESD